MERKLAVSMFGQKRLSREGGIEIVAKELCTRMVRNGCTVTCYNRSGHHVSGAEYDNKTEYEGIRQKYVPTIEKKGLAAVSSSFFAAFYSAFGKYDVVHIHAEGPAFFAWLPKLFGKKVVVTIHGIDWQREIIWTARESGIAWNNPEVDIEWLELKSEYKGSASAEGHTLEDGTTLNLSDKDQKWLGLKDTFKF